MRKKLLWITETAVMLALLVAVQALTAGFGNQFLTGSCVNAILAVTALMVGLWGGVVVAAVSPFVAFMFGIGPKFIQLVPMVAVGNLALVLVLALVLGKNARPVWLRIVAWLAAAAGKFAALYFLLVKLLLPALVNGGAVPQKAATVIATQFSWPQLITALIGGGIALLIVPVLRRALKR